MSGSGIKSARELCFRTRARTEHSTAVDRDLVRPNRAPENQQEEDKFKRLDLNKVIVRGRYVGQREVYDVLRIVGPGKMELLHAGCYFREEALSLAADALLGRISMSLGGVRTLFSKAQKGVVSAPARGILMPGQSPVETKRIGPKAWEVTPR